MLLSLAAVLLTALQAVAQCRYCYSYEEFMAGKWQPLDTIYTESHSKNHQLWWGGNDFKLYTNDDSFNKQLKKKVYIVAVGDTLFLNCRNLRCDRQPFGNGYVKAVRVGQKSLLFVNRITGDEAMRLVGSMGFGLIGGAIIAAAQQKELNKQVCYVISSKADSKGRTHVRLVNDAMIDQMLERNDSLRSEYYSEQNTGRRILASRVVPLLQEAGLFSQGKK